MKVILLENVKSLGNKGEIKKVADGYAMNFLIPRNLAVPASTDKIQDLENLQEKTDKLKNEKTKELDNLVNKISGKKITIQKDASEKGKLFAAVSLDEILNEMNKKFKTNLDKNNIEFKEHVKEIGEHEVKLKINKNNIKLKIEVIKN